MERQASEQWPQMISGGRPLIAALLGVSALVNLTYAGVSIDIAATLAYEKPEHVLTTPASLGLAYRDVSFPARGDHVLIRGWFSQACCPLAS